MSLPSIRIVDSAFLDQLATEAAATPRRRKNFNLHADFDHPCHRFFNALMTDTYVQPHCHADPTKDETVVLLRGKLGVAIFSEAGEVLSTHILLPGMVIDIPHGILHGWCCLADGSVFFEAKAGPYAPLTPPEQAAFAPPEGDPRASSYLAWLQSLFAGS